MARARRQPRHQVSRFQTAAAKTPEPITSTARVGETVTIPAIVSATAVPTSSAPSMLKTAERTTPGPAAPRGSPRASRSHSRRRESRSSAQNASAKAIARPRSTRQSSTPLQGELAKRLHRGLVLTLRAWCSVLPVISSGCGIPSRREHGRGDVRQDAPVAQRPGPRAVITIGTGLSECAVLGLPSGSSMWSALPWSAVTMQTPPFASTASTTRPRHSSTVSTAFTAAGITPVWPTMSGLAKLMIPKA